MRNIYTISELCELLSVTRPVVEKRLERIDNKPPLNTHITWTNKIINNREIKAVELSTEQEHAIGLNNDVNTQNYVYNTPNETHIKQSEKQTVLTEEMFYKVMEYQKGYQADLKSYTDRVINAETQLKLLEVSEASKDSEINRLRALCTEYEARIKTLAEQLEKERRRKFWQRNV
jgi:hypothetical protein